MPSHVPTPTDAPAAVASGETCFPSATAVLAVQLPAGAASAATAAHECRVALRGGAGGPVRKEAMVPLSEGTSGTKNPTSFLSLAPTI